MLAHLHSAVVFICHSITQAFVSSECELLRDVYVVLLKELGLPRNVLWLVTRPLCGLPEAPNLCFENYTNRYPNRLRMKSVYVDPCLLYQHDDDCNLNGVVCVQVEDSSGAGSEKDLKDEMNESRDTSQWGEHCSVKRNNFRLVVC